MDGMLLPIAPPEMTISIGSNNETIELINEGEINIPKAPALYEITFEARFPMRNYPYATGVQNFQVYWDKFKSLKENKTPFVFMVSRYTPAGLQTWDTEVIVVLEEFEINEDAEEGDDVLIDFTLKQYKKYGTKVATIKQETVEVTQEPARLEKTPEQTTYTVVSGDNLWNIARHFYGKGSKWGEIYNANMDAIEQDARNHGKNSSSNGHWIWPGLQLIIPELGWFG